MQDWSEGYMTDIGYTYGYYPELNPLRSRLALLNAGFDLPDMHTACELGFGQGVSVNINSAASGMEWHGTDFNPAQTKFAKDLAAGTDLADRLHDEAFEAFCQRTDLPDFDFIGLHGIWSWISDANRAIITDFIRRKLKVGGVLYISYNTQPGWAAAAPLRDLLTGYKQALCAPGQPVANSIAASLDFAEKVFDSGALYGQANPAALAHFKTLRKHDPHYLAHEYFNRDWTPVPFARMAEQLESAKLQYACSANYFDHVPGINLTPPQQQLLAEIPDARFRETVRDFMVNQRFRRDYWVRGGRRLTLLETRDRLYEERVILSRPLPQVKLTVTGALGEANLLKDVYQPVLDAVADRRIHTLRELEAAVAPRGVRFGQLVEAVVVLAGHGVLQSARADEAIRRAKPDTDRLNARLIRLARFGDQVRWLASPVSGEGVNVGRVEQLFLAARGAGATEPAEWARFANDHLALTGQRPVQDGETLTSLDAQLRFLTEHATTMQRETLPVFQALGIVD